MNTVIKDLIYGAVGGTVAYAITALITTSLITGTATADTFFRAIVPTVVAAGVVIVILIVAFRGS